MEHRGGCHCGNLRLRLFLTRPPEAVRLRACQCSFCRAHATLTASDPDGAVELWAEDWSLVEPYRFGTGTAEFMICRRCGVYLGAFCDTGAGARAVINTNALDDRARFAGDPASHVYEGEAAAERLARRAATWTPAVVHRPRRVAAPPAGVL
jgi:hypothetical protein